MFDIEDVFTISGRGVAVLLALPPPRPVPINLQNQRVVVQRPDGTTKELSANFNVHHFSMIDEHRKPYGKYAIMALFATAAPDEITADCKLLVSSQAEATIRAALTTDPSQ
jgi:hypothetical protein